MLTPKTKILGLLLVSLVLGACTPDTAVPATLPPTRTVSATETGTAVAQPPSTPTTTTTTTTISLPAPDTATPDLSQTTDLQLIERAPSTTMPTNTPRPTFTPSPTPTPIRYDLPAWVADPAVNVLLLGSYDDNETSTLFNVDTGEQFEVHVEVNENELSPRWLWQEGHYFISLTFPEDGQDVIDIETGELVKLANVNDDVRMVVSPDGRYAAHITRQEDRFDIVTLVDQEIGLETELNNPFQDAPRDDYNVYARPHWSPDGTLLAILYEKHYYDDNSDHDLVVYTASGEIFRQYQNIYISRHNPWSPMPPYRILYPEDGAFFSDGLCILYVVENRQSCLETITEWAENQNVWPYNFIWSLDGSKISFIYFAREERVNNSGACYIELMTEEIVCPITLDNLQLGEQIVSRAHFWSPDGRHLALFSDRFGPISDVVGDFAVTIVSSDGQDLQILGLEFSGPYYNPWRPSIPSPSQE